MSADEWSDMAVSTLLDCYSDKYNELNGGSIGTKGWQDVIFKLNSVCAQGRPVYCYRRCKNKLDVMKRRFKIERDRKAANGGVSDWPWFQKMEEIVSRNPRYILGSSSTPQPMLNPCQQPQPSPVSTHHGQVREATINNNDVALLPSGEINTYCSSKRGKLATPFQNNNANNIQNNNSSHHEGLLSTGEDEDDDDEWQSRSGTCKRRKKGSGSGSSNPLRHAREIARIVTEALERMEARRLEVMRELELKRNETQLQIARMFIESNRMQQQQSRRPSPASDLHDDH